MRKRALMNYLNNLIEEELIKEGLACEISLKKTLLDLINYVDNNNGPFFKDKKFIKLEETNKKFKYEIISLNKLLLSNKRIDLSKYEEYYETLESKTESKNSVYIKKECDKIKKRNMQKMSNFVGNNGNYYSIKKYYPGEKMVSPEVYELNKRML